MHSISINFRENGPCNVYLISDDEIKYDFKTNGTYEIIPDSYILIANCAKRYSAKQKIEYRADQKTILNSPTEFEQVSDEFFQRATKQMKR